MKRYVLIFSDGRHPIVVDGPDLRQACLNADITKNDLLFLAAFEEIRSLTEVACKAGCGCVYHAEDGHSCEHDLELVGLGDYPA